MTALPYFFFGTLMDPDVLGMVLGRDPGPFAANARLDGFARVRVSGEPYPALVAASGGGVEGVLLRSYSEEDDRRIRFFEDFDFAIEQCSVEVDGAPVQALFCGAIRNIEATDLPWSYEDWVRDEKGKFLRVARIYMDSYGLLDGAAADRLWLDTVREIYGR